MKTKTMLIYILLSLISFSAWGGKLDDFERDIQNNDQPGYSSSDDNSDGCSSVVVACCSEPAFWELAFRVFFYGGIHSYYKVAGYESMENNEKVLARKIGDPILPTIQFLSDFHYTGDGVFAITDRVEAGIGPIAVVYKGRVYIEVPHVDVINYDGLQFLYRMTFGDQFEIDFGAGVYIFEGNFDFTGTWLSMPIKIYPDKNFGMEINPGIIVPSTNRIQTLAEGEAMFVFHQGIFNLRGGISWFGNENTMLFGPSVGISLQL